MVKKSVVEWNDKCKCMVEKYVVKCEEFKVIVLNEDLLLEECFKVCLKLVEFFCNFVLNCVCNCCEVFGCLCGYYCKLKMFCIVLCEFGLFGKILGFVKLSW